MGLRVTKTSAGLALLLISLSGIALSRSLDWSLEQEGQQFGPNLPVMNLNSRGGNFEQLPGRNVETAEKDFVFLSGLDVSGIGVRPETEIAPNLGVQSENEPDDLTLSSGVTMQMEEDLRVAYAQYLTSLMAAEDALNSNDRVAVRQIELARREEGGLEKSDTGNVEIPAQAVALTIPVVPIAEELPGEKVLAPLPHIWSGDIRARNIDVAIVTGSSIGSVVQVSVASVLGVSSVEIVAPFPRPVSERPVLAVQPQDVLIVQPARDVSIDRLVHVSVQGSWPRRLDQINALEAGNIFLQDWGQNRVRVARSFKNGPYGYNFVGEDN